MKRLTALLCILAIGAALASQPQGCATWDNNRATEAATLIEARIAEDEAILNDPNATPLQKEAAAMDQNAQLKARKDLKAAVEQRAKDLANPPGQTAQAAAQGIAEAIPIYGGIASGLIGIGFGVYRKTRENNQAKVVNQVLAGIENAKTDPKNPAASALADALKASAPFIHAAQDLLTIKIVDQKLTDLKTPT